jgi:hypothetical protein
MKTDWYTRFILTVIAAGIVWLCIFGAGPRRVVRAGEQPSPPPVDVNIAAVGGKKIDSWHAALPADITAVGGEKISSAHPALPVVGEVEGKGGGFPIRVEIEKY